MEQTFELKPPPFPRIFGYVVLGHLAVIVLLLLQASFPVEKPKAPSKIVVKTVKLAPKTTKTAPAPAKPEAPKATPAKEVKKSPPPKAEPKAAPKAPPKTPPKTTPKKAEAPPPPPKKQQELLTKAENSLKQLKALPTQEALKVPEIAFAEESALPPEKMSYQEELISRLKLLLKLPEYGLLKLKLTLGKAGNVTKIEILSSTSALNRKHVEKTLPTLSFPPLGRAADKSGTLTLNLTLSSD